MAAPGVNQTISFQGRLLRSNGGIVPDGHYNMQFNIYENGSGAAVGNPDGALAWTETYINDNSADGIEVKNGYFSVTLGSVTPFGSSVDWNQDTLWLSMNVAGSADDCTAFNAGTCVADGEMVPMKRITSVPFALNSGQLGGIGADGFIQNGTSSQTADFNITGTGSAATLQGATSVLSALFDAITSATLSIGTATASDVVIGKVGATTTVQGDLQVNNIDTTAAGTLTIGSVNATSITLSQNTTISAGKSLTVVGGDTSSRPSSPTEGTIYYDSEAKQLLVYTNGKWQGDRSTTTKIVAAGNSPQSAKDAADFVANGEASVGAGTLDGDQIEINAAIATLPAGGGSIYLTEGTYYLDGSIVLPSNVRLNGAGDASVITVNNSFGSSLPFIANSDTTNGNTGIIIENLKFDGNRQNGNGGSSMHAMNLINVGSGSGSTTLAGATVTNSTFVNLSGNAIRLQNASNNSISNNTFTYIGAHGIYATDGTNNRIVNNGFASVDQAIGFVGTDFSTIINNTIEASNAVNGAVELGGQANNNTVSNNVFRNNTDISMRIPFSHYNVISNNLFIENGGTGSANALEISSNANSNTIQHNTFRDSAGTGYAIAITSTLADNTHLNGNVLGGPGAQDIYDGGTGTIYTSQLVGNGGTRLFNKTAVGGSFVSEANMVGAFVFGSMSGGAAFSINTNDNSVDVAGNLTTGGDLLVQTETDSANALQIQNSLGTAVLGVDTQNSQVTVGTVDTAGTLLVLDTKTTADDPTGVAGAMYYNSNAGKFRCYENNAWADCITPLPVSTRLSSTDPTTDSTTPSDVTGLSFALKANTKYYYKFVIQHESNTTDTGIGFGVTAPSGLTASNWCANTVALTNTANPTMGSYCGTGDATTTTTGADNPGNLFTTNMEGYVETGSTAGTLQLRFRSETNSSEVQVNTGSFGVLQIVQ